MLETLAAGGDVALVSDAGTPGISDPGERLVRAALDAGFAVSAVPGPTAAITALVISGLPTARFVFEGFLPRSGRERTARLESIASEERTVVLYEAPHRIARTLADLAAVCGDDRPVALARELTKMYEEVVRGTLGTVHVDQPRGEYVVVLGGRRHADAMVGDDEIRAALRVRLQSGASRRDAAAAVARELGVPKRTVYALASAIANPGTVDAPAIDEEGGR
jgi:16S rRNA (cytidine1402-2'-O)-methyltransferase